MDNNNLTTKQKEILYAIKKFNNKNGYSPSTRELCYLVNLSSTSSVHNQLSNLEKLGYIKRNKNKSRTIEVINDNKVLYLNSDMDLNKISSISNYIDLNEKLEDNILVKDNNSNKLYVISILNKYITEGITILKQLRLMIT